MKKQIPLSIICQVVANFFGCEQIDVFSNSRKRHIIKRRQWFQYLSRILNPEHTVSSSYIGKYYSDVTGIKKDHATVLHSTKVIQNAIDCYSDDAEIAERLILRIRLASGVYDVEKPVKIPIGYFCSPMVFSLRNSNIKIAV